MSSIDPGWSAGIFFAGLGIGMFFIFWGMSKLFHAEDEDVGEKVGEILATFWENLQEEES